jgi:hypothetical protein
VPEGEERRQDAERLARARAVDDEVGLREPDRVAQPASRLRLRDAAGLAEELVPDVRDLGDRVQGRRRLP